MTVRVASWRDVAMPPGVTARPTSASGLPVPFVAGWEGEETTELREDPVLRRVMGCRLPAVFSSPALEDARPTLGVMEPARQRHVVAVRLCQVCATGLGERHRPRPPWRQRLWLVDLRMAATGQAGTGLGSAGQTLRVGRRMVPLVFEPWVCEPCLTYALQVCPGILRASAGKRGPLRLLHVRDCELVAVPARISGDGPLVGRVGVSYLKVAVTDAEPVDPAEFLAARGIHSPAYDRPTEGSS